MLADVEEARLFEKAGLLEANLPQYYGKSPQAASGLESRMPGSTIFDQKLLLAWPPQVWRDVTVAVAVSGGPDSVALLRGLASAREKGPGQLLVAHFNHGLRGEQSQADEAFVVDLCQRLGLDCQVGRALEAVGGTVGEWKRDFEELQQPAKASIRKMRKRMDADPSAAARRICGRCGISSCARQPGKPAPATSPPATRRTIRRRRCCTESCEGPELPAWPACAGIGS